MEIKKAEIKDLDVVVKMKMEMFTEVGSISFLQENAEMFHFVFSRRQCMDI